MRSRRVRGLWVVGLMMAGCGGDKPSSSTPPEPAPVTTAAPTSRPTGTPLPGTSCNLPAVSGPRERCVMEATGDFITQMDAAIAAVPPGVVDGNQIRHLGRYRLAVLQNLERAGLCAQWGEDRDGHREIMVKNSNAFHEQYHIDASNGTIRNGNGAYRATCYPAGFPINPQPLEVRGDCNHLPASRSYGCDRAGTPQLLGAVEQAAGDVQRERPHLVDRGYLVSTDVWNEYHDAVVAKLRARGYCAFFNVIEISIKNTSELSEQYSMEYSWGQLRTGTDMWRSTCVPASF